jgi:hypothetical protein
MEEERLGIPLLVHAVEPYKSSGDIEGIVGIVALLEEIASRLDLPPFVRQATVIQIAFNESGEFLVLPNE